MSSIFARKSESRETQWARLIPGEIPDFRNGIKKPPRSAGLFDVTKESEPSECRDAVPKRDVWALIVPAPLQSGRAWAWLTALAADFALISLNWLVLGALFGRLGPTGRPISLLGIAVLHGALITLVGYSEGLEDPRKNIGQQTRILGKSIFLATGILSIGHSLQGVPWASPGIFFAAGLLHFAALCAWRSRRQQSRDLAASCGEVRNVLIVGAHGTGWRVASYLDQHPAAGRRVCGFLDDQRPLGGGVVGRVSDLGHIARKFFVDEVILATPASGDLVRRVLQEAKRLRLDLEFVPELFGCSPTAGNIEHVAGLPVICLHSERLPAAALMIKRLCDILGSGALLVVLSPLLAVIGLLIKLNSAGPVLYCAQRVGRKGRLFRCCKFRTMVSSADRLKTELRKKNERAGPFFKMADDPRITRIGRILRRYSLDELPQLWNVFRGEMSLVGPRPHPVDDVAEYEIEHLARLDVTPGLTGLWQVTARRDPSFQRGMELDREYIRTWTLGLDIRILLKTVDAVLQGSGE